VTVLAIKGLNQFYGGSHIVGCDLSVPAGSRTVPDGPHGMGKTTLLKCIMGLQATTSGDITFDGTDLTAPAEERARIGIGYVPQDVRFFASNGEPAESGSLHAGFSR